MSATYATGRCGCGCTGTVYKMTDRLWDEFFSGPRHPRYDAAIACSTCVTDWWRYAGPLVPVSVVPDSWKLPNGYR